MREGAGAALPQIVLKAARRISPQLARAISALVVGAEQS